MNPQFSQHNPQPASNTSSGEASRLRAYFYQQFKDLLRMVHGWTGGSIDVIPTFNDEIEKEQANGGTKILNHFVLQTSPMLVHLASRDINVLLQSDHILIQQLKLGPCFSNSSQAHQQYVIDYLISMTFTGLLQVRSTVAPFGQVLPIFAENIGKFKSNDTDNSLQNTFGNLLSSIDTNAILQQVFSMPETKNVLRTFKEQLDKS